MKTDFEGQKEWKINFGSQDDESATFAQETHEGEYILARTSSYETVSDVWVIKVGSEKT